MGNILVLLVGSNPLPNFIVAQYLLSRQRDSYERKQLPCFDKIFFVFSSKTARFKDSIVQQLGLNSEQIIGVNLENKIRDFDYIEKKVLEVLNSLLPINSLHLNYTGGTKPMAVGVSSAVEELSNVSQKNYSDLSPETFKLTLRNGHTYPTKGTIADVVKISVEQLYALHSLERPQLKRTVSQFYSEEFAEFLYAKIETDKENDKGFYKLWDKKYTSEIKQQMLNSLDGIIPQEEESSSKYMKSLQKFVRGGWLEEYLFFVLEKIKDECNITDLAWNIVTKVNGRSFELDVIAMKGSQSFVFTCTTAYDAKLCKGKAFEGIYRSEQIGGEHSKTILVCFADDDGPTNDHKTITNIKHDMEQFDAVRNFDILGSKDLKDKTAFIQSLKAIL